ncbi:hypothetical protein NW762_011200 [Fusarium torreyae]|uniref:Uncharacterized protein n=1 Tax=Fusarium torreyae TaxID=1237075 RepID=A0A9W8RSS0_9HYPO|nr:hypothetical protein NW762_011200 [Fusarium torreyae]
MALSFDEICALREEIRKLRSENEDLRSGNLALKNLNNQLRNEIRNLRPRALSPTSSPQPVTVKDEADALLLPGRICTFDEAFKYSPHLPEDKKVCITLLKKPCFIDNSTFSVLGRVEAQRMVVELICQEEPLYAKFISDSGICDSCDFMFI